MLENRKNIFLRPKFLIAISMVLAVVLIIFALWKIGKITFFSKPIPIPPEDILPTAADIKVVELSKSERPFGFPADFPFEKNAEVVKNATSEDVMGNNQIIHEYITSKSLSENFNIFKNYLDDRSYWSIVASMDEPQFKLLSAVSNPSVLFQITMAYDQTLDANVVTLNMAFRISDKN